MLGAPTDTYGCHFPPAQRYRHMLVAMLIVVGVGLALCPLTLLKGAAMVFGGPSASLVHTATRAPALERRVARQWTRDELEAQRVVRRKTGMDAFVWILQQLDVEEDLLEVRVAAQGSHRCKPNPSFGGADSSLSEKEFTLKTASSTFREVDLERGEVELDLDFVSSDSSSDLRSGRC